MLSKNLKAETFYDPATGLERRRRVGGYGSPMLQHQMQQQQQNKPTEAKTVGSKREVWNGTAEKTSGGLKIGDLGKNKRGHIVSVKKYLQGKQRIGQLAQSPYFGRIQDIAPSASAGAGGVKKKNSKQRSLTASKTAGYIDDIARLGGVGYIPAPQTFQQQPPTAFPPMVHQPFVQPMMPNASFYPNNNTYPSQFM
jgi:hypothetical protein